MSAIACNCLTLDDSSLLHSPRCEIALDCPELDLELDHCDIRELAEIAALRDIDTALSIYRAYRARAAR